MKKNILIVFIVALFLHESVNAQTFNGVTLNNSTLNNPTINNGSTNSATINSSTLNYPTLNNIYSATTNNLVIDNNYGGNGTLSQQPIFYGLKFGTTGSGEGIASARLSGANINGLNFLTNFTTRLAIANGGNIGIGTTAPSSLLHVQSGIFQITNSALGPDKTKTGLTFGAIGTTTPNSATDYSWIQSSSGPLLLNPMSGNTVIAGAPQTRNYVAIGFSPSSTELTTPPPGGYNLLVQGKIICEELRIRLKKDAAGNTVWYDHVFLPGYRLMSLDSLENYIDKNNHLPEIPSEAEVSENGIMAGEMNGLLLKKVEELTLYMIEQNKQLNEQNKKNDEQSKLMSQQDEQIELLKEQNDLLMQQVKLMLNK